MNTSIIIVKKEHLQRGIEKYQAKIEPHLQSLLTRAGFNYEVYLFNDQRVLLVLPNQLSGILYPNKDVMLAKLSLN